MLKWNQNSRKQKILSLFLIWVYGELWLKIVVIVSNFGIKIVNSYVFYLIILYKYINTLQSKFWRTAGVQKHWKYSKIAGHRRLLREFNVVCSNHKIHDSHDSICLRFWQVSLREKFTVWNVYTVNHLCVMLDLFKALYFSPTNPYTQNNIVKMN